MKVKQTGLNRAMVFQAPTVGWFGAGVLWLIFIGLILDFPALALGDPMWLSYPWSLVAYIFIQLFLFGLAVSVTWGMLDRDKRIVIDEAAGIVTVGQYRWLFGGKRYSLPLAAVTAVVIDHKPTLFSNSPDQRVSMVTDVQGRERIEVDSGKTRKMLSVGIGLSEFCTLCLRTTVLWAQGRRTVRHSEGWELTPGY